MEGSALTWCETTGSSDHSLAKINTRPNRLLYGIYGRSNIIQEHVLPNYATGSPPLTLALSYCSDLNQRKPCNRNRVQHQPLVALIVDGWLPEDPLVKA